MKVFDSTLFELQLPENHRFPMLKYRLLADRVRSELPEANILTAPAIDRELIESVHTPDYVARVFDGRLSPSEQRRIGFPWSQSLVERSRRSAGATNAAATSALEDGVSVNLAGGTHHAHADFGSGFCVFNDIAIAIHHLQKEGLDRFAVIDLDVHQGDGTATLFASAPDVMTTSMHCESNFPFRKAKSSIDIALKKGCKDEDYLTALNGLLTSVLAHRPEMVFFLAGADPFMGDKLGHLALSKYGLLLRDQTVLDWAKQNELPVTICMGGGYAPKISDIVDIHFNTVRLALAHSSELNGTL
ncbi:MAG: histone deacetylase [Bradymonadia bacterium]